MEFQFQLLKSSMYKFQCFILLCMYSLSSTSVTLVTLVDAALRRRNRITVLQSSRGWIEDVRQRRTEEVMMLAFVLEGGNKFGYWRQRNGRGLRGYIESLHQTTLLLSVLFAPCACELNLIWVDTLALSRMHIWKDTSAFSTSLWYFLMAGANKIVVSKLWQSQILPRVVSGIWRLLCISKRWNRYYEKSRRIQRFIIAHLLKFCSFGRRNSSLNSYLYRFDKNVGIIFLG